ncbi:F-box/kelch-repeat protein At3g23880-like [Eucalyptus grandis]|uniref:F-box/kelch-repeat protein At3g23880-like n=1 Tax=Eucalyptus grandis TaxID=71139 RepID=UPI00192F0975|nr:F-box/kelch-repeat protein At3g23880-like [Eucalyptus grandis]
MNSDDDDGPKLPQDVVVEILKRLPVGSLLRFRCVCRSWRSTIDDPRFVALHLNHSALDASHRYLACLNWYDPDQRPCSLFPNESLALHSRSPIEIPSVDPVNDYSLVGSCNGLICFTDVIGGTRDRTMCLWNLFTRKHKVVWARHLETYNEALGFGFDARSNDYKILRILYCQDDINRVEIYSLRTDSWRSLEREVPAFCPDQSSVFLNGKLYWLVYKHGDPQSRGWYGSIVSFDLAGEVFDEMTLRETFHEHAMVRLAVLDDSLAVFNNFRDAAVYSAPYSICFVWILREHSGPSLGLSCILLRFVEY